MIAERIAIDAIAVHSEVDAAAADTDSQAAADRQQTADMALQVARKRKDKRSTLPCLTDSKPPSLRCHGLQQHHRLSLD